jgi:hypothetical protein
MAHQPWWGARALTPGRAWVLELGALTLWVARGRREVRIGVVPGEDALSDRLSLDERDVDEMPPSAAVSRYPVAVDEVGLLPRCADRSVVVRTEVPINVLPGETVPVFVTTPAWVGVQLRGLIVAEIPTVRPSDTWYGPNPRQGSLCYASRSTARLDPARLEALPARVVTELVLSNVGRQPVPLDRVRVPVPALALYAGADGRLVTDRVLVVADDRDEARVEVAPRTGEQALSAPRRPDPEGMFMRALALVRGQA